MIKTSKQLKDLIRNLSKKSCGCPDADASLYDGTFSGANFPIPKEVLYQLKLMLKERAIDIWAYNLETILVEKLETIISRNTTNTHMRGFKGAWETVL